MVNSNLILSTFFGALCYRIEGGELFERVICDDFVLTEKACAVFMRQICQGVEYMHSQNIVHLDMKVIKLTFTHDNRQNYVFYFIFFSNNLLMRANVTSHLVN